LRNGTFGTPLAGDYFEDKWSGRTVRMLFDKSKTMPPATPGSLPDSVYVDTLRMSSRSTDRSLAKVALSADDDSLSKSTIQ
jgi:hypothetical protein